MKSSLSLLLLLSLFFLLMSILSLNFISKERFVITTLSVYQIKTTETHHNQCFLHLQWKNQPITAKSATIQIQAITGVKNEFLFDFNTVTLRLHDHETILIDHYTSDCQWLFQPVLVKISDTTLLRYLINQIFAF